jgi:DNA primase
VTAGQSARASASEQRASEQEGKLVAVPDRAIDEVRERADLVQVVGRHVSLKRVGLRYWGLCPFHGERTASFTVHPERQFFYCFGCGVGGDVITFRMRHDGLDFLDAVRSLAGELGIPIREERHPAEAGRSALYRANEVALDYFRHALRSPEGAEARAYLDRRAVPADLRDRLQIGFAPRRWDGLLEHLREERVPVEEAMRAGLVAAREQADGHYDRFRGRLMFPIREPAGRLIGFGGRALGEDTPKYLNTPESPVYRKGRALFALNVALDSIRERARAIVVEGYFDLIALHRAGLREGVAPCGTALTPEHARQLRRHTREVILLFDGDEPGRLAAERALPGLLAEGLRVRAAWLPAGLDPDSLIAKAGEAELRACVEAAVPLLDHLIEARAGAARHAWEKADVARGLAPSFAAIADPLERASYLRMLARELDLSVADLESALRGGGAPAPAAASAPSFPVLDPISREILGALSAFPELCESACDLELDLIPEPGRGLARALLDAIRAHGGGALARLLSPESALDEPSRHALARAAAGAPGQTLQQAERVLGDCSARLQKGVLEGEEAQIRRLLAACEDPDQERDLLERMQAILERKQVRAGGSTLTL